MNTSLPAKQGLYDPWFEHDACGVGVVANIKGKKSNKILKQALVVLHNMDHRGGQGADANSGDGAGVLLQIPHNFFIKECAKLDIDLPEAGKYAVGFLFLPPDIVERENVQRHFERIVEANGQSVLSWRTVPVHPEVLGEKSRQSMPYMAQVFIQPSQNPWPEFPKVFTTDYGQEEAIAKFKEDAREFCVMTQEFLGEDGHVTGVRICQNTMQVINGKRTEVPIPGTERILPAQIVLLAMGFAGSEQRLVDEFHVAKNARGSIAADTKNYMTSVPGVFTAGDARRGQSLVVWAIAEGRGAAAAVDKYLATK